MGHRGASLSHMFSGRVPPRGHPCLMSIGRVPPRGHPGLWQGGFGPRPPRGPGPKTRGATAGPRAGTYPSQSFGFGRGPPRGPLALVVWHTVYCSPSHVRGGRGMGGVGPRDAVCGGCVPKQENMRTCLLYQCMSFAGLPEFGPGMWRPFRGRMLFRNGRGVGYNRAARSKGRTYPSPSLFRLKLCFGG